MNSQNTPVHIKLWHREFWQLATSNLLLTMAVYMLIPTLPEWMLAETGSSLTEVGLAMGAFGVGLFLLGPFCSYLVQQYRRNQICVMAILGLTACLGWTYYLSSSHPSAKTVMLSTLLMGGFFGLAQMILSSTLVIDTSESFQRTEANHSSAWFGRFALSLGPLVGLFVESKFGFPMVVATAALCSLASAVLIMLVHFPFRTPEDGVQLFSLDRFFLPQGAWLFFNQLIIMMAIGLLLSSCMDYLFYALLMAGFFLALLAQRFVFQNAELKSEVVSGLILIGLGLAIIISHQGSVSDGLAPLLIGIGIGIIGSRFLLFFIKLSRHCQRGTALSSFMLSWESGLSLGLCLGYSLFYGRQPLLLYVSLGAIVVALVLYSGYVHSWFIGHKNR